MNLSNHTILIVEDDPAYSMIYSKLISTKLNAKILTAPNPIVAFQLIEKDIPSLIIMDMELPLMDGYSAIRILKSKDRTKDIPILASSALSGSDLVHALFKLGVSDFLLKPSKPEALVEKISKIFIKYYKDTLSIE